MNAAMKMLSLPTPSSVLPTLTVGTPVTVSRFPGLAFRVVEGFRPADEGRVWVRGGHSDPRHQWVGEVRISEVSA